VAGKYWWIKERQNPQLGTYYVACGQITVTQARMHEGAIYGSNRMHKFETKEAYEQRIVELRKQGERVNQNNA
jgi:hypothetical protein